MAWRLTPTERTMSEIKHRTVETNGIRMHIAESGAGPLVVLCHGFPESWYSWRHQLRALAEAKMGSSRNRCCEILFPPAISKQDRW